MIISYKDNLQKKLKGKKIVLIAGCFDLLHQGHIDFLKRARDLARGKALVVLLQPDNFILLHKGRSPVFKQKIRAKILDSIKGVDYVICLPASFAKDVLPFKALQKLKPSIYVSRRKSWRKFSKKMAHLGIKFKLLNSRPLNSSSKIIKQIQSRR